MGRDGSPAGFAGARPIDDANHDSDLDPIAPEDALRLYLDHSQHEVSEATLRSHESRLGHFVRWCADEQALANLNELSGRDLHEFCVWRRNYNGGVKPTTEKTQMDILRVFVRFLETTTIAGPSARRWSSGARTFVISERVGADRDGRIGDSTKSNQ